MTQLKNGFNGKKSLDNPDSLLARFIAYVKLCEVRKVPATRIGFAEHSAIPLDRRAGYGRNLVAFALASGYVTATRSRQRGNENHYVTTATANRITTHLKQLDPSGLHG